LIKRYEILVFLLKIQDLFFSTQIVSHFIVLFHKSSFKAFLWIYFTNRMPILTVLIF